MKNFLIFFLLFFLFNNIYSQELHNAYFKITQPCLFVNVNEINNDYSLVYPNPVENSIYFKNLNSNFEKIVLQDMNGRVIFSEQNFSTENHLNVEQLNNGIYMLIMFNKDMIFKEKIIIKN